jgi:hypothetical protein
MNAHTEIKPPALVGGGEVMAIVPQSFEETFRVARAVVAAGLAPAALIGKKTGDDAASAVSVCIMSGAELGLKPMVSLRSFTVINGKPALYGDGLINVVRQSGKAKMLNIGFTKNNRSLLRAAGVLPSAEDEKEFPGCTEEAYQALTEDERTFGFCEAERSDTGEKKTIVFTVDDAKRAGLWDDRPLVKKKVWENGQPVFKDNQPNDAPWYRFYKRMMGWRAAGYCLRELFGDVLGGIRDEYEAREIADADGMRDVTPSTERKPPAPPKPPEEPASADPATIEHVVDEQPAAIEAKPPVPPVDEARPVIEHDDPGTEGAQVDRDEAVDDTTYFDRLEEALAVVSDDASIEEVWTEFDPLARFDGKPNGEVNQSIAMAIRKRAEKRIGGAA